MSLGERLDELESLLKLVKSRKSRSRRERETHVGRTDSLDDLVWWRSEQLCDDGELVDVILAREQRSTSQHLGEDAPRTPDIDLDVVLLPCQHDLGGTVVARRDVAGHLGVLDTGEAKVADLEVAVFVDEDVAWFEVSVDDAGGMYILEASLYEVNKCNLPALIYSEAYEDLVEKVLYELLF